MTTIESVKLPPGALQDIVAGINAEQARWLVDYYYSIQDYRIQAQGQLRAYAQAVDEGHFVLGKWIFDNMRTVEKEIQKAFDIWTNDQEVGRWSKSIIGIGPVLAAGLSAHIDISQAPTVGHIWSFAGLNPAAVWAPKTKRPWNARLKVLCWKIGDSFVKFKNNPNDIYGKVYAKRKELEVERNEQGLFADQAATSLAERNIRDKALRATYEAGRLPAGRLDLRARRYAVKLFLSHWHHVAWESTYGEPPVKPYVLDQMGHVHFKSPPNWPIVEKKATIVGELV